MFLTVSDIPKIASLAIKEKKIIEKNTPKNNKIVFITFEVLKVSLFICFVDTKIM